MLWWNLREGASACHTHDVAGRGRWGRGRWRGHTPRGPSPGRSAVIRRDTPPLGRCEEDGRRAPASHARAQDRAHCAGRHSLRARIAPPHCTTPSPSPPPSPAAAQTLPRTHFEHHLQSVLVSNDRGGVAERYKDHPAITRAAVRQRTWARARAQHISGEDARMGGKREPRLPARARCWHSGKFSFPDLW
jgi:hypothetical protein